jgi:hypothetical protein
MPENYAFLQYEELINITALQSDPLPLLSSTEWWPLNAQHQHKWTSKAGQISPSLSLLDLLLWGYVKEKMYSRKLCCSNNCKKKYQKLQWQLPKFDCITYSSGSKAAKTLGGLKYCPMEILQGLATLATNSEAFGNTALWTPIQV